MVYFLESTFVEEDEEDQVQMRLPFSTALMRQRSGYAGRSANNLLRTINVTYRGNSISAELLSNSSSNKSRTIDEKSNDDWSDYSGVINDVNLENINDWTDSYDDINEVQNANHVYDDWSDSNDVTDLISKASNEDVNNNINEKYHDWSSSDDVGEIGPMGEQYGVVLGELQEDNSRETDRRQSEDSLRSSSISYFSQDDN